MSKFNLDILSSEFIDEVPLVIIGFDHAGDILYWNTRARAVTGYGKKEAAQRGIPLFLQMLLQEADPAEIPGKDPLSFEHILSGKIKLRNKETSILTRDGSLRHICWNSYLIDGKGSSKAVVVTGGDVTRQHDLLEDIRLKEQYIETTTNRLKKYISLDPHTSLLNYRYFMGCLNNIFKEHLKKKESLSLLIMDLDYFRSVNHIHGITNGDRILKKIAMLIKKGLKGDFLTARLGGAEFAVLMPRTDIKKALAISGRLFSVITDHDFKRNGTDGPINLTLHMAIGGVPHCEDVRTAEHLLDHVSDKLKEAKKTRNNSILICPQNRVVDQRPLNDLIIGGDHREYRYTVEFVNALANTVKLKDMYTREHSACMSNYAVSISEYMRLSEGEIRIIKLGAILHDIGKIGIDKMILLKPGALTGQEYDIIKQHPRIGAEIIRNVQPLKDIVPLVLYHHERFDGKGYLKKLKGEDIPLGARIISLADVFQALTSDRPYRKALPEKEALGIIKESSGTYFDPKVVKAFLEIY